MSEEVRRANQRQRQDARKLALEAAFPRRLLHQQCYVEIFQRDEPPAPAAVSSQTPGSPLPSPLVRGGHPSMPTPWPLNAVVVDTVEEEGPPPLE